MLVDRVKNRSFKKIIKRQLLFLFGFFVLLFLWRFYQAPADILSSAQEIYLSARGVQVKVENDIEFAYFNNCQPQQKCHCRLLIHGIGDSFHNWGQLLVRARNSNYKNEKWLAMNYPGTGHSKELPSRKDYQIRRFAKYLKQRIDGVCKEPIDIIANSLGAWTALWWVYDNKNSVRSLILLNPVGVKADYSWLADVLAVPTIKKLRELKVRSYYSDSIPPDFVLSNVKKNMVDRQTKFFIESQNDAMAVDDILADIEVPTLILWGESDQIVPKVTHSVYSRQIKNVEVKNLKKCGHIPQSECFSQTYEAMESFYKKIETFVN